MYKVLLVEDEEIIRHGIRQSVPWNEFGCRIVGEAGDGEEGVRMIEKLKPDIVITDINMPVMDGLAMLAATKLKYDYAAVILTGYSEFGYAKEAIRNGVSGYVLKPLNMNEMKEALAQAVLETQNISYLRQKNQGEKSSGDILLIDAEKEYTDPVVQNILAYIDENYKNKIMLADLAEELHYSERYISQKFQKVVGTTVIEYLNRYRIQKALAFIREKTVPLSEIGWEVGIGEYKYFNHVFKKYIGYSAKEYQQSL